MLVAQSAPAASRGTSLTIVNCLGFALTVVSIQVTSWLGHFLEPQYLFVTLAVGPAVGIGINRQLYNRRR